MTVNPRDPTGSIFGLAPAKPEAAVTHHPADLPVRGHSLKPPRVPPMKDDGREPSFNTKLPPPPTLRRMFFGNKWSWAVRGVLLVVLGIFLYYCVKALTAANAG